MAQIPRVVSQRPTLTVDAKVSERLVDANRPDPNYVGRTGTGGTLQPWSRWRIVTALPLNATDGPVQLQRPIVFGTPTAYLVDPDGNFVGQQNAIYVSRILTARWVEDTRRLGG